MRIKSKLGYTWAALGIPIMLTFMLGMDFWMNLLFIDSGLKYSEGISGGEVKTVKDHQGYVAQIHKPVFEGYFRDTNSGFIQIDWITKKSFPEKILEDVDYDGNGTNDFRLELNTEDNTALLIPYSSTVRALSDENVMVLENQRTVRVRLVKEDT